MTSTFLARNRVAVVGYAHSDIVKHAGPLARHPRLETAKQAIADAGLRTDQIDGFTSSALFPSAGNHTVEDGISTVSSSWLAQHLGVNPDLLPASRAMASCQARSLWRQCHRQRGRRLRARAPRSPQSGRELPREPMQHAAGAMQWTVPQGYFGRWP